MNINKLKAKSIEYGENLEKLSESLGIERSTFYRWLKEEKLPVKYLPMIAKKYGLSRDEMMDIFFNSESPHMGEYHANQSN